MEKAHKCDRALYEAVIGENTDVFGLQAAYLKEISMQTSSFFQY